MDINSDQLYRYWLRKYNGMFEIRFFNRDIFNVEKKGYNYLFGIKSFGSDNYRAFYIRWRNEAENPNSNISHRNVHITSDNLMSLLQRLGLLEEEKLF